MEVLKEMPKRNPINGTFELTVRCNLKCKMCLFRHDDSENEEIMANELTTAQWIDMAKQVAEAGTYNLLITGGEPLLRPDFCEIYEGIYKLGFIITLYTNATLVTDKVMETLKKYPPHRIGVTIYGASEETYEKVCGNGKAFDKAIEGIKRLKELPSIIEFRTTIIKDNYNDIDNIERLIQQRFGKDSKLINTEIVLNSVRGGVSKANECRLNPRENALLIYRRSLNAVKKIVGEDNFDINNIKFKTIKQINHSKEHIKTITLLGCNAGMNSYCLTWNGKLIGCQLFDRFYTEPFKEGFINSWIRFPYEVNIPELNSDCRECVNVSKCAFCCATVYAETKNLKGHPDYLCNCVKELNAFLK